MSLHLNALDWTLIHETKTICQKFDERPLLSAVSRRSQLRQQNEVLHCYDRFQSLTQETSLIAAIFKWTHRKSLHSKEKAQKLAKYNRRENCKGPRTIMLPVDVGSTRDLISQK